MIPPKLKVLVDKIRDKSLRMKVSEVLENPTFDVAGKIHSGLSLDISPAGLSRHHCYPGGYVEHVISTANIALAICDSVEGNYHGEVDRDLVLAGILLHDIFKPLTYEVNENGDYDATHLGDYMDHLSIATSELVRRGFPLTLIHIVSSHHGNYGPIRPRTIEALVCHLADLADSQLNGAIMSAAAYLTRKATGQELHGLNSKEAFEIVHSKTTKGWEGVTETVAKVNQRRKSHKT